MADVGLQRLILRTILSLPRPILRGLAGGGVVYQGERTLDPRFQYLAHAARSAPGGAVLTPAQLRAASAQGLALTGGAPEPGVRVEDRAIEGPRGSIPLRLYRPELHDPTAPVLVFSHFGGGVIGDLETCHAFCTILSSLARCAVVSVDYRLAPEHRFPAGLEDVLAAFRWARDNAESLGAAAGQAAIGGNSMGGNFSAVVAQELKRAGEPQPVLQLLIYPAVDMASETQSMTTYGAPIRCPRR